MVFANGLPLSRANYLIARRVEPFEKAHRGRRPLLALQVKLYGVRIRYVISDFRIPNICATLLIYQLGTRHFAEKD